MDNEKLGRNLVGIGIAGLVISFAWWSYIYSWVNQTSRGHGPGFDQMFQCLFSLSGPCGFLIGAAASAGQFAYQPMLLWISAAVVVVGIVVTNSSSSQKS